VLDFLLSNIANIFIFMILYDFCLLPAWLLCNQKCIVYEKPYAYCEPMYALENCQWCGEPYFAVSVISIGDIMLQIPMQGKHKSLRI
jgi:hypothetical protein